MSKDGLLSCPFCANEVVYGFIQDNFSDNKDSGICWITCQSCNMETRRYYNKKDLFELWNRRKYRIGEKNE